MSDAVQLFDRSLLAQRRLRAAASITNHDFLLKHIGEDFGDRLGAILRDFPTVVNWGASHGVIADCLRSLDSVGDFVQADSCDPILRLASGLKIVADEGLVPFKDQSIDLFVSALSLHFVNDLPGALWQIRRSLKPDGLLLAALPGGRTLNELRDAFAIAESETIGGVSPRVGPFSDIRDCGALLQRAGFALPVVDSYELTITYESPIALMAELRGMGAQNVLMERLKRPLKRETLMRACDVYVEKYGLSDGRIPATVEIITLTGWAPHESQQKPLQPGSAKLRLADAIGAREFGFDDKGEG